MLEAVDCVVVGGGPAGLVSATYLARFRRRVVVLDAGRSRAEWIPSSRNIPGFPEGIAGKDYLALLRSQAERNGADLRIAVVDSLGRDGDAFRVSAGGAEIAARSLILATGVIDTTPDIPDLDQAIRSGRLRLCPICDGFEATGLDVGVVGTPERGLGEALFLASFTNRITVLRTSDQAFSQELADKAASAGLRMTAAAVSRISVEGDHAVVELVGGEALSFDALYVALGNTPQTSLATALGAACNAAGCLVTDDHRQTTVPMLFAVGDVVDELNQISVAAGHAAVAATAAHNRLKR